MKNRLLKVPIKRYRLSPHAACELAAWRLTIGDVAVILRWGEKHRVGNGTSYWLKQWCIPRGQEKKLRRLLGIEVVTSGRRIVRICRSPETKP